MEYAHPRGREQEETQVLKYSMSHICSQTIRQNMKHDQAQSQGNETYTPSIEDNASCMEMGVERGRK